MNCTNCCYNLPKDGHPYCTYEEGECVKITELEKENAELKGLKDVATLIRANNDTVVTLMQLNNMLVGKNQQLTEVKRLLASWISDKPYTKSELKDLIADTEQFLKDSEVEK